MPRSSGYWPVPGGMRRTGGPCEERLRVCGAVVVEEEKRFIIVPEANMVVVDSKTGLMWQRGASDNRMVWKDGFSYVEDLNSQKFGGYNDWRYPTKEDLATLILAEENRRTGLFIDAAFGRERNCWSSTQGDHHQACYADFYYGDMYVVEENYANFHVRAVRSA